MARITCFTRLQAKANGSLFISSDIINSANCSSIVRNCFSMYYLLPVCLVYYTKIHPIESEMLIVNSSI